MIKVKVDLKLVRNDSYMIPYDILDDQSQVEGGNDASTEWAESVDFFAHDMWAGAEQPFTKYKCGQLIHITGNGHIEYSTYSTDEGTEYDSDFIWDDNFKQVVRDMTPTEEAEYYDDSPECNCEKSGCICYTR